MVQMGLVTNDQFLVQLRILNNIIAKSSALGLVFIYGISIFFSHSIAGPIYKLERVFDQIAAGNMNVEYKLRRLDEFQELAAAFERAMKTIRNRIH